MNYIVLGCVFLVSLANAGMLQKLRPLSATLLKKQLSALTVRACSTGANVINGNPAYSDLIQKANQEIMREKEDLQKLFKTIDIPLYGKLAKDALCMLHQIPIGFIEKGMMGNPNHDIMESYLSFHEGFEAMRNILSKDESHMLTILLKSDDWDKVVRHYAKALDKVYDSFAYEAFYKSADWDDQARIKYHVLKRFQEECLVSL